MAFDPYGVLREDVEMDCEKDEEPLAAEVSQRNHNTKNPPVERNKNLNILDMLSKEVGAPRVLRGLHGTDLLAG